MSYSINIIFYCYYFYHPRFCLPYSNEETSRGGGCSSGAPFALTNSPNVTQLCSNILFASSSITNNHSR